MTKEVMTKEVMTKEVMEKEVMEKEVGGNHENDYLRAKCAYLKLL